MVSRFKLGTEQAGFSTLQAAPSPKARPMVHAAPHATPHTAPKVKAERRPSLAHAAPALDAPRAKKADDGEEWKEF
jgi:hypothetical protein